MLSVATKGAKRLATGGICQGVVLEPVTQARQLHRHQYHTTSWQEMASTSRVTLSTPMRQNYPSLYAPILAQRNRPRPREVQRRFEWRAGLATEATASSTTPSPQITKRPAQPEDPDVYTGGDPSLIVTERAAQHLSKVATKEQNDQLALRVAVEPGGCHGYQYKMELTDEVEEDDFRFSVGDKVHLIVDSTSLRLIKGSTIDYVTELIGSQFAIFHNPQAKGAGCGCGVSWEPAI